MKISVDRLFHPDIEAIEIEQTLRFREELGQRYPNGVRLNGRITHISHGVHVHGSIEGSERETCVRCLEPFWRDTNILVEETYSEDVKPQDELFSDVAPLTDRSIDLSALVAQLLEVEEPLAPVCRESCAGLCPRCGVNRNEIACGCAQDALDERLAGLAVLRDELSRDEELHRR
ncbi:MAG: DUF177 domain-containing protein [Candidatus Eremiobacter antarcticus]|nr:DUF177 domain-containing protein [Candidatus Eremiobacteraeota bacterium]MBC5808975.1 DUF177 domain-containing protein [Candidatus Eremiobacteraeota bacterium]PZR60348.1 MAG: DUF177 domain-containing protein [Candidatus Eremiobacter sp. RRmetagenome_bin22]